MKAATEDRCSTAVVPAKRRPSRLGRLAAGCVFWTGMALVGLIAIPMGILAAVLCLVMTATDILTDKFEKD